MGRLATNDLPGALERLIVPPHTVEIVSPSDSDELNFICRVLRCDGAGSGGAIAAITLDGTAVTITLADNTEKVGLFRQVLSTGTTAGGSGQIQAWR